ncbi:MAG TPA: DUF72 domain-containing protein [Acidimicrobiales bacterium]|nr:DUF72 domain-containing protein [Acidimicrobiales bacterium]
MVGTCSWTDPTLTKDTSWYPRRSMSAAERLSFYAGHFPIVEADSTYYRPLQPELARTWSERAPAGFCFDIKAYGLLTGHPVDQATLWPDLKDELTEEARSKRRVYAHHLPADALEEAWARTVSSLKPLGDSSHLGALLLQYPPWFVPKRANREELARLPARLAGTAACVEFRSPGWLSEDDRSRTVDLLRELGLALVVVDAPSVSGLQTVLDVTNPNLSVVRFHGRANDTWKARDVSAAERFRYLYSAQELEEWVPRARELAASASRVHLLMNNCYQDYGVRNAGELAEMLAGED